MFHFENFAQFNPAVKPTRRTPQGIVRRVIKPVLYNDLQLRENLTPRERSAQFKAVGSEGLMNPANPAPYGGVSPLTPRADILPRAGTDRVFSIE